MERRNRRNGKKGRAAALAAWVCVPAFICTAVSLLFALSGAESLSAILSDRTFWLTSGVFCGAAAAGCLALYRVDSKSVVLSASDMEDTDWLSRSDLRKLKEFSVYDIAASAGKRDGIVIGAERHRKSAEIVSTDQMHALIVGTTGSGKTTGFVDQNIAALSRCGTKPLILVTDPKNELYTKHAAKLREQGYKISVIDLRRPYSSARWNPMSVLTRRIKLVREMENNLRSADGRYTAAGETFMSYREARTRVQELRDEIFENARDLVYTLCPIQNKEQPTWEDGARNLILGLVLAFCEDCVKGKMEDEKLLLFNVYHNITRYCSEDTSVLKKYLMEGRDEFSKVRGLVNTVLITSERTLTSYLSEVNGYMQQLADDGILYLTSGDDLDVINADEGPNAVFVVVPDERMTRHRFVTLFVTQTYKELVEKAGLNFRRGETETPVLKRNAYFVLDEFGNLPKFENMENMITVARSRGIRYLFVLQSFSQLEARYGRAVSNILKTNCNVKIFIGSDDPETRREFSGLCGSRKTQNMSIQTSSSSPPGSSVSPVNRPLITESQLERLNGDTKGDAVVSVRGYEPIRTVFTPSYELESLYFGEREEPPARAPVFFDRVSLLWDIAGRTDAERALEELEREERRESAAPAAKTPRSSGKWKELRDAAEKKLAWFSQFLDEPDRKVLAAARLEDKADILYGIMDEYNAYYSGEIHKTADYVSEKLREMSELRKSAERRNR